MADSRSLADIMSELGHDVGKIRHISIWCTCVRLRGIWDNTETIRTRWVYVNHGGVRHRISIEIKQATNRDSDPRMKYIYLEGISIPKIHRQLAYELLNDRQPARMLTSLLVMVNDKKVDMSLIGAITRSRTLKTLDFDSGICGDPTHAQYAKIISTVLSENRSIETMKVERPTHAPWPKIDNLSKVCARILESLSDNWVICDVVFYGTALWPPEHENRYRAIVQRNIDMKRQSIHSSVTRYAIPILPLRMSPYELLWILDWIPPMHHRFNYKDNKNYDPRHVQKIRLIERLTRSYAKLIE